MTLFDSKNFSEIRESGWSYNTLRPPLKIKEVVNDLKNQWYSYYSNELKSNKRMKFIVLRIFQRIAYNLGWILETNKYKKSLRRMVK